MGTGVLLVGNRLAALIRAAQFHAASYRCGSAQGEVTLAESPEKKQVQMEVVSLIVCGPLACYALVTMTKLLDALPFDDETLKKFTRDWTEEKNWHELANFFPLMNDAALDSVVQDIKEQGQIDPIALFEGKVLDGRHRVLACKRAGKEPRFEIVRPKDPFGFVVSRNSKRRDLTKDQRGGLAAKLVLTELATEARQRQEEAGRKHGAEGGRGKKKDKPLGQNYPKGNGRAAELAAKRIGKISATYVKDVIRLEKKKPGLIERIVTGEITIRQAKKEADNPFLQGPLSQAFVVAPFSVLDAQAPIWEERKQFWKTQGAVATHEEQSAPTYAEREGYADTSSFDPVLAECICLWFCPPGGRVLDPFAGECVKGIVAAKMGLNYLGIDDNDKQVRANQGQAKKFSVLPAPKWLQGNSENMSAVVPEGEDFDLVFTSPPYYDLEKYSERETDISAKKTYAQFMESYRQIFAQAVGRLKWNRFLVVKVGEIRDKKTGFYRNFVGDNIACFKSLGLNYYNEIILFTSRGSVAMRAGSYMESSRKIGKTHQNVLCFFKGDDPTLLGEIKRPAISTSKPR